MKRIIHIHGFFRRCFKEKHIVVFFAILGCLFGFYASLTIQVTFVAKYQKRYSLSIVRLRFAKKVILPSHDVVEAFVVCYVVHNTAAISPAIECQ